MVKRSEIKGVAKLAMRNWSLGAGEKEACDQASVLASSGYSPEDYVRFLRPAWAEETVAAATAIWAAEYAASCGGNRCKSESRREARKFVLGE